MHKLELTAISPTFAISDLRPYVCEEDELALRTMTVGRDDENITGRHSTMHYKDLLNDMHELM